MFRSDGYADLSLNQWLALTPRTLVEAHLGIGSEVISALSRKFDPAEIAACNSRNIHRQRQLLSELLRF
jgi:oxalate decarboxylase